MSFTNCQRIMVFDIKEDIDTLKAEGRLLPEIIERITAKYSGGYWCATRTDDIEEVLNTAIYYICLCHDQRTTKGLQKTIPPH